jgi:hypothetical protein
LSNLKKFLRRSITRLPGEGRLIIDVYRHSVLLKRKASARLRPMSDTHLPDAKTLYWIDPARIVLHTNRVRGNTDVPAKDRVFDLQRDKGTVQSGDWDTSDYRFADLDVARAITQRVSQGVDWRKTDLYARLLKEVETKGTSGWNIGSVADLDARMSYLDKLIESMRTQGYLLNHAVRLDGERKGVDGDPEYGSEITVNIGRDGQYLFQDGRHRLAIAKVLGIPRVPVRVLVRHRQWAEFRRFVQELAQGGGASSHANELYQNPLHPDLQDIPHAHACEDRFEAMLKWVPPGNGAALLDIGANLGYFCHRFETLGYSCFAVEYLAQVAEAAERIRVAEGRNFQVISQDLFVASERPPLRDTSFSVVLALNIFHHFIKTQPVFDKFSAWLGALRTDTMFFEPHCPDEPQMRGSYRNFDEQQFVDFIISKSVLTQSELIHRCSDGRPIYKLTR